ncbi:unnamed protein product [Urochloa humidicola]
MGALDLHLESAAAQHGQAKLNVEEHAKGCLLTGGNYIKEKIDGSNPDDYETFEKGKMQYGCSHYKRRCRIRAPCCNEIFDCRHCHNEVKNSIKIDTVKRHELPRHEVQQVICSLCGTEQEVQQVCINCGVCMGKYFCGLCKLFDDDVSKQQYHCNGCGICRYGRDDFSEWMDAVVQEAEVEEALKRMKGGKAMGPDGIPIEVWRCLGVRAIVWLTKLFNLIFQANKMPEEWRRSILVPIFKNKGDVQSCTNYRGIKLMSHTMKLWERVIEHRLRRVTNVTQNRFGFMPGRSTMEAIFLIRQLMERYREQKKDLHMVFIDLEKAYDKVPRNVMWWALEKHKVPTKYITLIKDMYKDAMTFVRTCDGDTSDFPIQIGLHQGIGGRENFFHCSKCGCCYSIVLKNSHACVEGAMHHDCPICFEYLFESTNDVSVLPCGHTIHVKCLKEMEEHCQFACPLCSKSVCDMSKAWERLDMELATLSDSCDDKMVRILCNDCGAISEVQFHLIAHKCQNCKSYNTRQI